VSMLCRNMQMVVSALLKQPEYAALLGGVAEPGAPAPSIPRLQLLVERAWRLGIDTQVCPILALVPLLSKFSVLYTNTSSAC
jgi:hypothetical protein